MAFLTKYWADTANKVRKGMCFLKACFFTVKIHLLATPVPSTGYAKGAPTIYPLVDPPADKVFCLCSSACVERALRAGGEFSWQSLYNYEAQTDYRRHGDEIAVIVKEEEVVFQGYLGNETVDCAPNSDSLSATGKIDVGCPGV